MLATNWRDRLQWSRFAADEGAWPRLLPVDEPDFSVSMSDTFWKQWKSRRQHSQLSELAQGGRRRERERGRRIIQLLENVLVSVPVSAHLKSPTEKVYSSRVWKQNNIQSSIYIVYSTYNYYYCENSQTMQF